jgi:hypothetical protein
MRLKNAEEVDQEVCGFNYPIYLQDIIENTPNILILKAKAG